MKYSKIFRTLAVAIILSLLMITLPATPAYAVPRIYPDPEEGEIGDRVDIEGLGFRASSEISTVSAYTYFSSDEADVDDDIDIEVDTYKVVRVAYTDTTGAFDTYFYVPDRLVEGDDDEDVHGGTYYVYAVYSDETRIRAVAEFTVIGGVIELDLDEGPVGTEVEITGEGFDSREDIIIEYDGDEIDIESGDDETDRDGEFECTIIILESTAGDHTITVIGDDSDRKAEAEFTVEPEITIDPEKGSPGSEATVTGTGFASNSEVTIDLDRKEVATDETDKYGSFEVTFDLPQVEPGTYDVKAEDEDKNDAEVEFTLGAGASFSPTTGNVTTEISVSGAGFKAGLTVTIKYDDTEVATATADSNGAISATFPAPASLHGSHTITATDGTNTVTSTFTMESTPPPAPKPLLPEMGIKAKSPVHFDWEDVDDPSGVTYTLQVASDEEFASIVLEKDKLTKSEYTLTKGEELESTKKEAPYYWRVRAIDNASNEGKWTTPGEFYVGGLGFTMPGMPSWGLYLLFVLGAFLIGLIGYLLGRRTSYY